MKSYLYEKEPVEMIPPPQIKDPNFESYVAFDIETTGLGRNEEIIEIGAVRVRDRRPVAKFNTLVRSKKSVPYQIQEITGISDIELCGAPKIDEVMPSFLDFIGDDILLGHNIVSFDSKFICREAANIGINLKNPLFDTLTYAKSLKKLGVPMPPSLSLSVLCQVFKIEREAEHRAYDDALANAKVFYFLRALEKRHKG